MNLLTENQITYWTNRFSNRDYLLICNEGTMIYKNTIPEIIKEIQNNPDMIYTDEDLYFKGERLDPILKPDYSKYLIYHFDYLSEFFVIKGNFLNLILSKNREIDLKNTFELVLYASNLARKISHINKVLYSITKSKLKNTDYSVKVKALNDFLENNKKKHYYAINGKVLNSFQLINKVKFKQKVSIIIPTKDKVCYLKKCISSILKKTSFRNYEIVVIDNASIEKATFNYYEKIKNIENIRIVSWNKVYNFSSINNFGVSISKGDYIILLNNDTEVISHDWIEQMLKYASIPDVGAVGAKLLYPNGNIQHVGISTNLKTEGMFGHILRHIPTKYAMCDRTYSFYTDVVREVNAVTAACLMVSKQNYKKVNGLDENFPIAFNDVDFCYKLLDRGLSNIFTPYAELYHHENVSVGKVGKERDLVAYESDKQKIFKKWGKYIHKDKFYNYMLDNLQ